MNVNDKIFLARMGSWDMHYSEGTVTKVTPAGLVDVQIGTCEPMRFRADGKLQGGKGYHEYELDRMPYDERKADLAKKQRAQESAGLIQKIAAQQGVNFKWGKDGLNTELDRLQVAIDAARASVEAI
jgi:hypothetical protein